MTPIADMVEQMLAENAPAAAIVAAVRAMERVTVVTLSSRDASRSVTQEQSRIRSQNYRNRKKQQQLAKANDVAAAGEIVTARTVTRHASSLCETNNSIQENSLSIGKEEKKEERQNARARGTRLAAGSPLKQEFIDAAIEAGAHHEAIPKIWTEFVDYWSDIPGQRGCKISWLGTWRNNVKRVVGNGHWSGQKNGRRTVHDAARDLHAKLVAEANIFDEPAPNGLCEREGQDALRLLPPGRRQ